MRRHPLDIRISIHASRPSLRKFQGIVDTSKTRRHIRIRSIRQQLRARLLQRRPDLPRTIQPLRNIHTLVPPQRRGRAHRALGASREQVGLISILPDQQPSRQGLARERHGVEQRLPAGGAGGVAAQPHVEAVRELGVGPLRVRLEVAGPDGDGRGVVGGARIVEGAVQREGQRGVVQRVVLRVAPDADVRLGAGEVADVVEQVV